MKTVAFFFQHYQHFPSFHSSFPPECTHSYSFFVPNSTVEIHKSNTNIFRYTHSMLLF
jgi:hypothetical protein